MTDKSLNASTHTHTCTDTHTHTCTDANTHTHLGARTQTHTHVLSNYQMYTNRIVNIRNISG